MFARAIPRAARANAARQTFSTTTTRTASNTKDREEGLRALRRGAKLDPELYVGHSRLPSIAAQH